MLAGSTHSLLVMIAASIAAAAICLIIINFGEGFGPGFIPLNPFLAPSAARFVIHRVQTLNLVVFSSLEPNLYVFSPSLISSLCRLNMSLPFYEQNSPGKRPQIYGLVFLRNCFSCNLLLEKSVDHFN
ncbi:hypothetical protein M9H77_20837 [Catharanthus roseus]|uniref:Uncharacterized protein n=1 Tax=Catharanthus roseus TaxID=4058 RepID=A0ACC0AMX5_CATRO|nr:hypothetical protein M9H77_20837 [Catharanthus roseus]